jgi:threonine synthase
MDIQVSSNFERLLFDLHGRDGAALGDAMRGFEASKAMSIGDNLRAGASLFGSARVDEDEMAMALRWACSEAGEVIDPHTAIALSAARAADLPADVPVVTLATAHAAKFRDAVERATGLRPTLPSRAQGLFDREERYETLPADLATIEAYIAERAVPVAAAALTGAA